ncbi:MAG TPA: adenine phosphoribosyltransferase [Lachnospiraceae bacterium]|nr:adenine phosphoribosyltransferase [Lachnospiraceae bacterium]
MMDLAGKIRCINDYPQEGIVFRDITTLLKDADGLCEAIDKIKSALEGVEFDYIIGPESRGFIFGMPISYSLRKGFIPVRKEGKLPAKTKSREYALEYGTATVEIHEDAIKKGDRVVIIDDLIATGGTSKAIIELLEEMGATVEKLVFLIELENLEGRKLIGDYNIESIIRY